MAGLTLGPSLPAEAHKPGSGGTDTTHGADGHVARRHDRVTVVRNVRPFGGRRTDLIAVDGTLVRAIPRHASVRYVDGGGRLAVPTLIDSHIHPDKTGWGEPWQSRRPASDIDELVAADVEFARALPTPIAKRALRLMSHAAAQGTRAMRAHADVAPAYGLAGVEALVRAREKLRGVLDVQIVGFPQHGVARTAGTAALLERAAAEGLIDFVGGIDPAGFDHPRDGRDQLDIIFDIAEKHGIGLDIHLHDVGEQGLGPLRDIVARTKALGLHGKVTVSHAFAIPELSESELDALADQLAELDIALTTAAYSWSTVLPYRRLIERGVRVGLGSDGVRDSWSPFGNADMLHRTWLLGWANDMRTDADLESAFQLACNGGATVLGLPPVNLKPGSPADFMLIDGENVPQIVVDVPPRTLVFRAGRVVARDGRLV